MPDKQPVKIHVRLDIENPSCKVSELEPLIDQALKRAKTNLIRDLLPPPLPGGASGENQCRAHDKEMFDKSRCPD